MPFEQISNNVEETDKLAEKFANAVKNDGAFVCLFGDIGAGKTAFSRYLCKHLGVKEKVTSPSFVILNEYHSGVIPVYHFDLYRLESEGVKTISDELEEYSQGKLLTLVEWAEFSENKLPFDRIEINIEYVDDTIRNFIFNSVGERSEKLLEALKKWIF